MSLSLRQQVDLTSYNSFAVPARAAWFAEVASRDEVIRCLAHARQENLPFLLLGGGSNCLFVGDFHGLVIKIANRGVKLGKDSGRVTAAAGENWHDFVIYCMNNGLHGLENLALIPGTVGAAPIQNIGAYGVELAEFFVSLEALNLQTGAWHRFDRPACEFSYRDSLFKRQGGDVYLIWSVTLQLHTDWQPRLDYGALQSALEGQEVSHEKLFEAVCAIRRSKLPDPASLGNAGSFFKNPVISQDRFRQLREAWPELPCYATDDPGLVKLPAAWLLEKAGWKGRRRGAAAVHKEHALVLVNPGTASGEDIYLLAQEMSSAVLEKFGIALQPEVRIIVG